MAYAWGLIDNDSEIVEKLFQLEQTDLALDREDRDSSSPGVYFASSFVDILRRSEDEETQREHWQQIIEFWRNRITTVSSIADAAEEFSAYTRVLKHAPAEVSLDEIVPLLCETAPGIRSDLFFRIVLEYVAQRMNTSSEEITTTSEAAITVLDAMTQSGDVGIYLPASDECWTVVKVAAENGHDTALEVAERLLEAGHPEYRQIIKNINMNDDCSHLMFDSPTDRLVRNSATSADILPNR